MKWLERTTTPLPHVECGALYKGPLSEAAPPLSLCNILSNMFKADTDSQVEEEELNIHVNAPLPLTTLILMPTSHQGSTTLGYHVPWLLFLTFQRLSFIIIYLSLTFLPSALICVLRVHLMQAALPLLCHDCKSQ